jgi:hypothetical protein
LKAFLRVEALARCFINLALRLHAPHALKLLDWDVDVRQKALDMGKPRQGIAGQTADKMPALFVAVFLSLCVPIFFSLAGLHLSFSRLLLMVLFPYLFFQVYSGKCGGVRWIDIGMLLFVIALAASIFVNNRNVFVTFVGSNVIIILGGYMAGRVFIRGPGSFTGFIKLFGFVLLFTLPFAVCESQTSVMVIPRLLDKLPIISSSQDTNYLPRHGLFRVQVLFTHPIHYGLFASMCFSLIYVGLRNSISTSARLGWTLCVAACCFSSVSSGPFLAMLAQVALIFYAWVASGLRHKWRVLIGSFVVIYTILELMSSRSAFFAIAERLAFNSHTAYVRRVLLDYGLAQVGRTPFLGVGYNKWDLPSYMSGSLDNYWLMTALVYGIPAFVFLFSAFIVTLIKAGGRDFSASSLVTDLRLAWSLVIASLILTLSTVAIWSDIATLVFLFLGSGAWLLDYEIRNSGEPAPVPLDRPEGPVYTRFPVKTPQMAEANRVTQHSTGNAPLLHRRIST